MRAAAMVRQMYNSNKLLHVCALKCIAMLEFVRANSWSANPALWRHTNHAAQASTNTQLTVCPAAVGTGNT